jgi:hypothetical protein
MLTSMEGMEYMRSQKEIISYLIVLHSVGGLVSMMFTHPMLSVKFQMTDYCALHTTVHYTLLYTFHYYIHEEFVYIFHRSIIKGQPRQYSHRCHLHMSIIFCFLPAEPQFQNNFL